MIPNQRLPDCVKEVYVQSSIYHHQDPFGQSIPDQIDTLQIFESTHVRYRNSGESARHTRHSQGAAKFVMEPRRCRLDWQGQPENQNCSSSGYT